MKLNIATVVAMLVGLASLIAPYLVPFFAENAIIPQVLQGIAAVIAALLPAAIVRTAVKV